MKNEKYFGNIILIGPPGSGKSTIGRKLSTKLSLSFCDTDDLLESEHNRTIQDIIKNEGEAEFKHIEAEFISNLCLTENIISTGGSVGLDEKLIDSLKSEKNITIFMNASPEVVIARIGTIPERLNGVLGAKSLGLETVIRNRVPLYLRNADIVFEIKSNEEPIDMTTNRLDFLVEEYLRNRG